MTVIVEAGDGGEAPDLGAEIARIAHLDLLVYEATRVAEASQLNIRVGKLDWFVKQRREQLGLVGGEGGGETLLRSIDPWPEPVDIGAVLDGIVLLLKKYAVLPDHAAPVIALWAAHSHAVEAAYFTPRLAILSAEKGSGKSTILDILGVLCPRTLQVANITAPALFRIVESERPTLLIDEADTFIPASEDLRGILNAGHKRGSPVARVQGDAHEVRLFQTFSPVALAGIGDCLPDTVRDRSIPINMQRALSEEKVARLRLDRPVDLQEAAAQLARFAVDSIPALRGADPEIPAALFNRAADNWRAIFAIADLAGGHWPETARTTAMAISSTGASPSHGVMLLEDMRAHFLDTSASWINSTDFVVHLCGLEDRPWPEFKNGKGITAQQLATLLRAFGISSKKVRSDGRIGVRGYAQKDFEDAWRRYLPRTTRHAATDL